jgi:hypothetical protein
VRVLGEEPGLGLCNELCTCAAKFGVIGHAAFCQLGEKAESDAVADTLATVTALKPGETW